MISPHMGHFVALVLGLWAWLVYTLVRYNDLFFGWAMVKAFNFVALDLLFLYIFLSYKKQIESYRQLAYAWLTLKSVASLVIAGLSFLHGFLHPFQWMIFLQHGIWVWTISACVHVCARVSGTRLRHCVVLLSLLELIKLAA